MLKLVFILVMGFSVGCSRQPDASPTSLPDSSAAAPGEGPGEVKTASDTVTSGETSTPPSPVPQRTADLDAKELDVALAELTQVLRRFSFEHKRVPKTFNEVVAAGYMKSVPQAPPGKKFEIDPKTVQVVMVKQ